MIEGAERRGELGSGATIIEPTSGNTGVALAFVAAVKGYPLIITMPETMSIERRKLLSALGARLVLTEGKLGMKGAIAKAEEMPHIPGSFIPSQFENPDNPQAHYGPRGPRSGRYRWGRRSLHQGWAPVVRSAVGRFLRAKPQGRIVAVGHNQAVIGTGQGGPHTGFRASGQANSPHLRPLRRR